MLYIVSMFWLFAAGCLVALVMIMFGKNYHVKMVKTDMVTNTPLAIFIRVGNVYKCATLVPGDDFYTEITASLEDHRRVWNKLCMESYVITANSAKFYEGWLLLADLIEGYNVVDGSDKSYEALGGDNSDSVEDNLRVFCNCVNRQK